MVYTNFKYYTTKALMHKCSMMIFLYVYYPEGII
jgi:hypothetical protein